MNEQLIKSLLDQGISVTMLLAGAWAFWKFANRFLSQHEKMLSALRDITNRTATSVAELQDRHNETQNALTEANKALSEILSRLP